MKRAVAGLAVVQLLVLASCGGGDSGNSVAAPTAAATPEPTPAPTPEPELALSSTAFAAGAAIPPRYTCSGMNVSPPLEWTGVPGGTQVFVLIVDDPDAPGGTFVHWLLYDIPAETTGLEEGVRPAASVEGRNDFGRVGYGSPCPPAGSNHRYFFRLYALDASPGLGIGARRGALESAMAGHILSQAELMGTFGR